VARVKFEKPYGCAGHRNRGTCTNELTIQREQIEARVLSGLKRKLMAPQLVGEFIKAFTQEINRLRRDDEALLAAQRRELNDVKNRIAAIIDAIEQGIHRATTKNRLLELEAQKASLDAALERQSPTSMRVHPNLASIYRKKVVQLEDALNRSEIRSEAAEAIRGLISEVRITPIPGSSEPKIELVGDLAAILELTEGPKASRPAAAAAGRLSLVAGEGFEPPTKGL
jgi:site-specific DNA recombinase